MLHLPTPFPFAGSYALHIDMDQPPPQEAELVRVIRRDGEECLVAFPLRRDASGTKTIRFEQLIDATPLSDDDWAELKALDRELFGRVRPNKLKAARREALRDRERWAPRMGALLRANAAQRRWAA